jgi:hypothetical protein
VGGAESVPLAVVVEEELEQAATRGRTRKGINRKAFTFAILAFYYELNRGFKE